MKSQVYTDKHKFKQDKQDRQDKKENSMFIVLNYPVNPVYPV
jgi:hypothetical protein